MYLLNYNGSKTEDRMAEVKYYVENGIKVDTEKIYHTAFYRILDDIYKHREGTTKGNNSFKFAGITLMLSFILDGIGSSPGTSLLLKMATVVLIIRGLSIIFSAKKYIIST